MAMAAAVPLPSRSLVDVGPVETLKAVKNGAEIGGLVRSGVRDAAAIVSFISWLHAQLEEKKPVYESQAAEQMYKVPFCSPFFFFCSHSTPTTPIFPTCHTPRCSVYTSPAPLVCPQDAHRSRRVRG